MLLREERIESLYFFQSRYGLGRSLLNLGSRVWWWFWGRLSPLYYWRLTTAVEKLSSGFLLSPSTHRRQEEIRIRPLSKNLNSLSVSVEFGGSWRWEIGFWVLPSSLSSRLLVFIWEPKFCRHAHRQSCLITKLRVISPQFTFYICKFHNTCIHLLKVI
jgi:hypothetical protein